jgi:membrane associated rhomboid family serine protease
VVLGSSLVLLAQRALDRPLNDFGAIVGPVGSEWWRFFAAPFAYTDMGYLFVVGLTIAVFGSALERRLGTLPVALLFAACGALGMLAADALDPLVRGDTHILVAAGGNGIALGAIAAWLQIRRAESRGFSDDYVDLVGVAVFVAVLAVLPLVEDTANGWVALGGLAVGAAAGLAATLSGRGAE